MENISLRSIKWESIKSIFYSIAFSDKISRADISAQTGLSLMTVGKVADALLDMHVIVQNKESRNSAGRRAGMLSVAADHYAVILDLTNRDFRMTVINIRLEVLEKFHYTFNDSYYFEENLQLFLKEVRLFLHRNTNPEYCIGFGVSVPGPYFPEQDRAHSTRIPELEKISLAAMIRDILEPPALFIEAAYNAAATSNIARIPNYKEKLILYWFISEGNICGTVVNHGEVLRGAHKAAGNFGHMRVARGRTLEDAIKVANTPEENAHELAKAIRNVIQVVDPDMIILECELYRDGDAFIQLVQHTLENEFAFPIETLPQLTSAGCKYRHSHRGLTMKLREMWLSDMILGEKN